MTVAMLRFRIQVFIPLFPGMIVLMAAFWIWTKNVVYLGAIPLATVGVVMIFLEMRMPIYLPDTATVTLGYNHLTHPKSWMNSWLFSDAVHAALVRMLGNGAELTWAWQIVSLTALAVLNVCGLPMVIAAIAFFASPRARRDLLPISFIIAWMLLASLAGAMIIKVSYDNYSVGGQMVLHECLYGFPLLGLGAGRLYSSIRRVLPVQNSVWTFATLGTVVTALAVQHLCPRTPLQENIREQSTLSLTPAQTEALLYLRDHIPADSVVASPELLNGLHAVYGGIGGRACYYEYVLSSLDVIQETQGRRRVLIDLWAAPSASSFQYLIRQTPITHLIEYADRAPLRIHDEHIMRKVWESSGSDEPRITIWQIISPGGAAPAHRPGG